MRAYDHESPAVDCCIIFADLCSPSLLDQRLSRGSGDKLCGLIWSVIKIFGAGERSSARSIDDWVVVGLNLVREIINTIPYVLAETTPGRLC
jgi:hypothetical protein